MIQYVTGSAGVSLLECVSPRRGKWRIRWNVVGTDDGCAAYMEAEFGHRPSMDEIRETINGWYNSRVDERILTGYEWNGKRVYLSSENQFNYKAAYDLAVQTGGGNLPIRFKFGSDEEPTYHDFTSVDELTGFYMGAIRHIQQCLNEGWAEKDAVDYGDYACED